MFECTAVLPDGTVETVSGTLNEVLSWADKISTEHTGCSIDIREKK